MNEFLPYWIASLVVAAGWSIYLAFTCKKAQQFVGLAGAWGGVLVLTAFWQADAVPMLWIFLKFVLVVWQSCLLAILVGTFLVALKKLPGWRWQIAFAALSTAVHVVAGIHFLWIAIMTV